MCWTIFFKNFFFKQSLILSGYFLMISIWPTFANICCPYFFSKDSRFQKCLLFFYPRLKLLWSRVQQNNPDEKSVGDSQTFESNRGQQWSSRTGQIKICQGCSWGQNFDWFLREKKETFLIVCPMARAAGWKKRTNGLFDRPQRVIRKLNDFNKLTKVFTTVVFLFRPFPFPNQHKISFIREILKFYWFSSAF